MSEESIPAGRPEGTDEVNDSLETPEPQLDPDELEHMPVELDEVEVPDGEGDEA